MSVTLVKIPDVPIVEVGTFMLSTGPATFTEEHLAAAVAALQDPAVKVPRIKIDGLSDSFDPQAHGGEPAFGRVEGMRLSADGQSIIGDLVVPDWLAAVMEWAYPARSIEGGIGWESPTGKTHGLVITALALLGVDLPGVTTLEDLPDLLSGVGVAVAASMPTEVVARMPQHVRAGIDQDLVRSRYYAWLESGDAELPDEASMWDLWVRSLRFDDGGEAYLKVTDESTGRLYRVGFTVSGADVTFTDHQEVVEQDVPVAAGAPRPRPALAVWASKADSRPTTTQEDSMDPAEVRRSLGLAEDATDEQVQEAFTAAREAREAAAGDEAPAAEVEQAEPVAASAASPETVTVSAAGLAELRVQAEQGARAHTAQLEARRDAAIADGLKAGRFPKADEQGWRTYAAQHPGGFEAGVAAMEQRIAELAPGLIPVGEIGGAPSTDTDDDAEMSLIRSSLGLKTKGA